MTRLAALFALWPLGLPAQTPQDTMDALIAASEGPVPYAAVDAVLTDALQAARARGALEPDWAYVIAVGATTLAVEACNLRRAFALFDEAETVGAGYEAADFSRARRAVLLLQFGFAARAEAVLADISTPLERLLDPDTLARMAELRNAPPPPADSPFMDTCFDILARAQALIMDGDAAGARSLMIQLNLPDEFLTDPALLVFSIAVDLQRVSVAAFFDREEETARLAALFNRLTVPGSTPPALDPRLSLAPGGRADVANLLYAMSQSRLTDAQSSILSRWIREFEQPADMGYGQALLQLDEHLRNGEARQARLLLETILARPDLDPDQRRSDEMRLEILRLMETVIEGGTPSPGAFTALFARIETHESLYDLAKVSLLTEVVLLSRLGAPREESLRLTGRLFDRTRALQRAQRQIEAEGGAGSFLRLYAPPTISLAFREALEPTDGHPAPVAVCQDIQGLETCTILVEEP